MKKLLILLLVLPFMVYAQSTNENHVVTKVYKKATTSPVVGHNTDEVTTSVQYFDGLGRLKQTVAVNAGGNTVSDNAIPIDWTLGNTGPTDFFTAGTTAENRIINGSTPFGGTDLLWECIPDAASNFDGGWNTQYFTIDNTKSYRYTIWVKRTGSQSGTTYHGTQNVDNLNGTANSNPYFWAGDLPQLNTWYLLVGVVHPHTYRGSDTGVSGVYDINGNKVIDGTEYRWRSDNSSIRLRNYLYNCTDTNVRQYFWSPLFQQMDGGELPLEDVITQSSPVIAQEKIKDIVSHVEYDEYGRMSKEYLPVTNGSGNANIRTDDMALATQKYYGAKYANDFTGVSLPSEINAYSEKEFDGSPLNRLMKQAAPGYDWRLGGGHEIKFDYDTNSSGEVKIFEVTTNFDNNTYIPTLQGGSEFYAEGELYKTITKDENWTSGLDYTTEEFKNKEGQVILKRTYNNQQKHDTYYVYDDFGNLTYVIPPKAEGTVAKPTTTQLSELCYQYVYDHRNRLVEKKIPGKGWEYIIYDKLDRPVMTQDANQHVQTNSSGQLDRELLFTKYDQLGRVVYTGYTKNLSSRATLQNTANTGNYTQYEERTSKQTFGGTDVYYTKTSVPHGVTGIFTINYYDTYVDLPTGLEDTVTTVYGQRSTSRTKGLPTVSKVRVLETNNWITTVTYYDEKARPIYVYSKNDYLQTIDVVESKLDDFTGKVLETTTSHQKTGQTPIVTVDRFEYDHMDRLVSQTQQINNQISERIVKNNYDDLGQLESKLVGNGTQDGFIEGDNITVIEDRITKTGGSCWQEGLVTKGSFQGSGYIEFEAGSTNSYFIAGMSVDGTNENYQSIEYSIICRSNNTFGVYESGVNKINITGYEIGNIFRIERVGNRIEYKKDGKLFYTSQTPSTGRLVGDISMCSNGGLIKDFKIVDNSKGLQKVDFDYNVRGWLTKINDDAANDNDLFNFNIAYNNPTTGVSLYNGNISQTSWNSLSVNNISNPVSNQYTYSYDALNRITQAVDNTGNYNLNFVGYDKNGNIKFLERNGAINSDATSFGMMDDLQYVYDSGNKLKRVADIENPTYGFIDVNTDTDYTYDANGNMISDSNKRITNISYNHLNLPTRVTINGQNINYMYDASGVKLSKNVNNITTEYAGNYIYENNTLQFFNHPEGYVKADVTSSGVEMNYVYQYKDHLGNVRLSYTDNNNDGVITPSTEIIEESNYYPFGLKHKGYNGNISSLGNSVAQKFGFQGIELEESLGLNLMEMEFRQYDPAIARFTSIDPVTHHSMSTYTAFDNNPVYFSDPSGADAEDPIKKKTIIITSSVDQNNVTTINQTTRTSTTVTNEDGSTTETFTTSTITNTVDAEGNVTSGTTATERSGTTTTDANGDSKTSQGKKTTRNLNKGEITSSFGKWTNTVSNYNKNNEGTYNQNQIDTGSYLTTSAFAVGSLPVTIKGGASIAIPQVLSELVGAFSLPSSLTLTSGNVLGGMILSSKLTNKYSMLYDVKSVQNGKLIKDFRNSNTSRKDVSPSWSKKGIPIFSTIRDFFKK